MNRPATGAAGCSDRGDQKADVEVSRDCQQGELSRRKEAAAAAADGADEQLQRMIWDPGGFQHLRWEAHEQELMNFAAEEYDAGASLHVSQPASQPRQRNSNR
jgi:hypothetical protein